MHVGSNPNCEYIMAGAVLQMVNNKRDIGVLVNQDDIKPSLQCAEASRRASTVPGQITRTILCHLCEVVYSICPLPLRVCGPSMVTLDWTGY